MKKIAPHLWFDKEAEDAAGFYVLVFPGSRVKRRSTLHGVPTPTGDCDVQPRRAVGEALPGRPVPETDFVVYREG
jgi:hypothetical protein